MALLQPCATTKNDFLVNWHPQCPQMGVVSWNLRSAKFISTKILSLENLALYGSTTACYTWQTLWKERNQLEDEVHLKLGGENILVAAVIIISSKFPYYRAVGCIKL